MGHHWVITVDIWVEIALLDGLRFRAIPLTMANVQSLVRKQNTSSRRLKLCHGSRPKGILRGVFGDWNQLKCLDKRNSIVLNMNEFRLIYLLGGEG